MPRDWEQLEELFERGRYVAASDRIAWLEAECHEDPALRKELESLLKASDEVPAHPSLDARRILGPLARDLMDPSSEGAADPAPALGNQEYARLAAAVSDRYTVGRELGRGSFATVYLAEDRRHGRLVALKVVRPELVRATGMDPLLERIRVAAGLHHPHILPLFDSGDAGGFLYCVLPHIEGATLRDRITREGRLPLADALEVTAQVAAALGYAHRRGVVHRDVKPENILIHPGGALLADFDAAIGFRELAEGAAFGSQGNIGTPPYMSPEQIMGREQVTGRSDLYALASVLYEMLAGVPPFTAATAQDLMSRLLEDDPTPVNALRPEVRTDLARVIQKALAKAPADRFETVEQFAAATTAPADAPLTLVRAVAALPFDDLGVDSKLSFLAEGLTVDVIRELSRLPSVRVIGRDSTFAIDRGGLDPQTVGRRVGVDTGIVGDVRQLENRIHTRARLLSVSDGSVLWSGGFDRSHEDVADLRRMIPSAVATALRLRIADADGEHRPVPAIDRSAYLLYLRAQYHMNRLAPADLQQALACLHQAIQHDADFAPAYASLAEVYLILGGPAGAQAISPEELKLRGGAAIESALELDDRMPDAHAVRGMLRLCADWDWEGADASFARAHELGTGSTQTHLLHAWYLICAGRLDQALDAAFRAETLDPLSLVAGYLLATTFLHMGRIDQAIAELDRLSASDPSSPFGSLGLFLAHVAREDLDRAEPYLKQLEAALPTDDPTAIHCRGCLQALRVDGAGAVRAVARLSELEGQRYVPPMYSAWVQICLGDLDSAFENMERAFTIRDSLLLTARSWPWGCFEAMRADPRWTDLSSRLGIV